MYETSVIWSCFAMLKNYKSAVLPCLVLRFFVTVDISVQITKILKEEILNISVPKIAIPLWPHIPTFQRKCLFSTVRPM